MNLAKKLNDPVFKIISKVAHNQGLETYVVGGYVRDILLERPSKDIDFVCVGSGIKLAEAVQKALGGKFPLSVFKNFGTAMIKTNELELEFVGARKESYQRDSRKPIVEDGTLEDVRNVRCSGQTS